MDLSENDYVVNFVYLSEERLYTAADDTLYVYSMSDLTSPVATYPLCNECYSGMIIDDHLYLGGDEQLYVFKVTASLTQPFAPLKVITTKS